MSVFGLINRNLLSFVSARSFVVEMAKARIAFVSAIFILLYALVAFRAFDLSVIRGPGFAQAHQEKLSLAQRIPHRGNIYDRNGVLLATSIEILSLYADPKMIIEPTKVASELKEIWPELDLEKPLSSAKRFIWVKRHITPDEHDRVMQIGQPGLQFKKERKRVYPMGRDISHVVGCVSLDQEGLCGIERFHQDALNKGQDLTLTIDMRVQHSLRKNLKLAFDKHSAIGAVGIVMDIQSGEIVAASSLPDYDPNILSAQNQKSLFNRLSQGVYELGSTFKIFSTAGYLEYVDSDLGHKFDVTKPLKVGRFSINDYHAENRILTTPEVFIHSSNIGSAFMGQALGTDRLKEFYASLGLLDPLNVSLKEKAKPLLPKRWGETTTLTASYGHGLAVTPLHLVRATASILNDGIYVEPRFFKQDMVENIQKRVVSKATSDKIKQLLRSVVTHGTGKNADIHGFVVGGKTGTAEKSNEYGYDSSKLISSFIGAFPMTSPKYLIFMMIDEPKATKDTYGYATGGWVAAPFVKKIVADMASLTLIPPVHDGSDHEILTKPLLKYLQPSIEGASAPGQTNLASN